MVILSPPPFSFDLGGRELFFENRTDAGQKLAEVMVKSEKDFAGFEVVGIARGGVIVAQPIATALGLPLQSMLVDDVALQNTKLTATSLGNGLLYTFKVPAEEVGSKQVDLKPTWVEDVSQLELEGLEEFWTEFQERSQRYNNGPFRPGSKIILVDDGLVTGTTLRIAAQALYQHGVEEVVAAIPVVLPWIKTAKFDFELITWRVSTMKRAATGMFYYNFEDTPDEEVTAATAA